MQHLKVDSQENGISIQELLQHLNHHADLDTGWKVFK